MPRGYREDLVGKKFHKLFVIRKADNRITSGKKQKKVGRYECLCDCGNKTEVDSSNLSCGLIKSCGCIKAKEDTFTGRWFCRLKVVSRAPDYINIKKSGLLQIAKRYNCICSCGNNTIVHRSSLTTKNTRSCGCLSQEVSLKKIQEYNRLRVKLHA